MSGGSHCVPSATFVVRATTVVGDGGPAGSRQLGKSLGSPFAYCLAPLLLPAWAASEPMAMTATEIETLIKDALPDARVELTALADDNDHWAARVVSSSFAGMSRVQQHQRVYAALQGRLLGGDLHALQLETAVSE